MFVVWVVPQWKLQDRPGQPPGIAGFSESV